MNGMQTISNNPSTNLSNPSDEGRDWIDNTLFDSGGMKDFTEEVNSNFGKDLYLACYLLKEFINSGIIPYL